MNRQTTHSLCPECLSCIPARLVKRGNQVTLEKGCPEHGLFETVIWRGTPHFSDWHRPKFPYFEGLREAVLSGCPYDCGLCSSHHQRTCTALVEVTSRCNLGCPVCFADSGRNEGEPELDELKGMFEAIMARTGGCNLQLSGGEPTVRHDLPEIIKAARSAGFTFIQLNTNGLKLAQGAEYAAELHQAGLSSVFLQFDGMNDRIYQKIRGRALFATKCRAIEYLSTTDIGIVLVPTLVPGLNTDHLWEIVRFGLSRHPHVRGVHFQPISYFGRFPKDFSPEHFTLPEVMHDLSLQSKAVIRETDFQPPGCEHALCSFSARYLVNTDGSLDLLGNTGCDCQPQPAEQGALRSIEVTARQWGRAKMVPVEDELQGDDDLSRFLRRAQTHTFGISGMAFQDCWNLDLNRLRGCCIHVAQPDGRLIPFCSFNLTSRSGQTLYRKLSQSETAAVHCL